MRKPMNDEFERLKRQYRLDALTQEIEAKTEEWTDLGEEIEGLVETRKRYAKRHRLPIPGENKESNHCKRCRGTGYIPSETYDMGCAGCQDKCPDCGGTRKEKDSMERGKP